MSRQRQFNYNDLSTWSWWFTGGIAVAIIGVLFFVLKAWFIDEVSAAVQLKKQAIVAEQKHYQTNKKMLSELPRIRGEIKALMAVYDVAKKYLPTDVSMPSLIDSVYRSARNNGIVFNTFAPQADIDMPFYTIKPITLSADVGFVDMAAFIEEVTTLKRIMNVHSVSFLRPANGAKNSADVGNVLRMTAELRTYVFKENSDE